MLELSVGVDVGGMARGGYRSRSVFAEIESGDGSRFIRFPMPHAEVTVLMLFAFGAGGDQAELARPAHGEVIGCEFGGIAEMRVPAFPRAHKQHTVSGVLNDVATIVKFKGEFLIARGSLGEHDSENVEAAGAALLQIHSFVLKEGAGFAVLA